ncbi:unnamed protein product, partial [Rotaria sp. Silwood1]
GLSGTNRHIQTRKHQECVESGESNRLKTVDGMFHIPASELDKLSATEGTLVFHAIKQSHSYVSQACTVKLNTKRFPDSSVAKNVTSDRTKAREIACNVLAPALTYSIILALRDVAFFSIAYYSPNKGNVKMEPIVVQLFSKSSVCSQEIAKYFDFVEQEQKAILKQIRLRWLSLLPSIRRFIVVHPVAKNYFLNLEHNEYGSFGCKVGQLLKNVQSSSQVNDFKKLFRSFIHSVIDYIEKYYNCSASLYQSMPVFSEINIEKIEWKNIQHCCTFVEDDMISQDGLYNDFNHIKSKYIVLREKYDGITKQVQSFILSNLGTSKRAEAPLHDEDSAHDDDGCNATNDSDSGSNDDDERNAKYHKEQKENLWIRSDYLWTYLLDDERVPNLQKLVKFVFSIPVSNGYCETVFSHMKYLWNHNRNRMKQNLVGAEPGQNTTYK